MKKLFLSLALIVLAISSCKEKKTEAEIVIEEAKENGTITKEKDTDDGYKLKVESEDGTETKVKVDEDGEVKVKTDD